jgi:putative ABC transport system ATP-binding protein
MLELKHIERFYPLAKCQFFYILRDVNLKIEEGDFVSIMGPSGAGKSSLLHVLGLHDHARSGENWSLGGSFPFCEIRLKSARNIRKKN